MPVRNKEADSKTQTKEVSFMPSNLETIDRAFFNWLHDDLGIFSTTNKGWKKVPIIWVSAERAFQIKKDKNLRDSTGALALPLITLERTSVEKSAAKHGVVTANIPPVNDYRGGSIKVARRIQQEKTSLFAASENFRSSGNINSPNVSSNGNQLWYPKKNRAIVYETITSPLPTYVNVSYSLLIKVEYQQQLNEILTPFLTRTGQINNFFISHDGHRFEGFLPSDFAAGNNLADLGEEERKYETKIDVRILGHLVGEDKNQERPKVVIRENAVKVRFPRERVALDDEHPSDHEGQFYRE